MKIIFNASSTASLDRGKFPVGQFSLNACQPNGNSHKAVLGRDRDDSFQVADD
jgi:hypothetical protein